MASLLPRIFLSRLVAILAHRNVRYAAALSPAILALGLMKYDVGIRATRPFFCESIWVGLILVSWVGWGSIVSILLFPRRRLDWGLRAALGMATVVLMGGVLGWVKHVSVASIEGLVAAGLIALGFDLLYFARVDVRRVRAFIRCASPLTWIGLTFAWGCVIFRVAGSIADTGFNSYDDRISYMYFPLQFLGSGTLDEPFSIHRILALGGQSFLGAMVVARGTIWNLHAVDGGLAYAVLFGLVLGQPRSPARPWGVAVTVGLMLVLGLAIHTHNIGSELTGVVFFFALFRLFDAPREQDPPWAAGAAVALIAAATCTLRQNFVIAVGAILAVHYVWSYVSPLVNRQRVVREALAAAGVFFVALAPWLIFAHRSSGTYFYPVVPGNARPDFGLLEPVTKLEELRFFIDNVTFDAAAGVGLTFAAIPFLLGNYRSTRAAQTLFVGSLLGGLGLIHGLRALDDRESIGRYYFSFAFAYALAAAMVATALASRGTRSSSKFFAAGAVALAASVAHLSATHDGIRDIYEGEIAALIARRDDKVADDTPTLEKVYVDLQRTVPKGAPLLVLLDDPFRLDFKRNHIMNLDQPGAASPGAGLPIRQGEEALAQYLLANGVRYIAFRIDGSSKEYSLGRWAGIAITPPPVIRNGYTRGVLLQTMASFYTDVFGNLLKLATTRHKLFAQDNYFVLDLKERG
jgi:hypothetical protein